MGRLSVGTCSSLASGLVSVSCPGRGTPDLIRGSEDPGPRSHSGRFLRVKRYGATRLLRWVPGLVPLAQVRSPHSPGTRGFWHLSHLSHLQRRDIDPAPLLPAPEP